METASPCNSPHCRLQIPRMHRPMGDTSTYTHTDIHTKTHKHIHGTHDLGTKTKNESGAENFY